ncbi:MAG TPA: flavin reductase family protein [Thermoleophilia bacterium]
MGTKIDLGPNGFIYPMPVTLVGADLAAGPNFMTVAWITRVQPNPPRLACGLGKGHATNIGIREHREFSVCLPSTDQLAVSDWCGLVSAGSGADKAAMFSIFRGALEHAPMIAECPLCLECRVERVVDLGSHELFVADLVATWTEERFLDEKSRPDIEKLRPFTLTMPDKRYWAVGDQVGEAWSVGRSVGGQPPAE